MGCGKFNNKHTVKVFLKIVNVVFPKETLFAVIPVTLQCALTYYL